MQNNREKEVLDYITNYIYQENYPPTVREICSSLGFKSTSTAQYYLKKLEENHQIKFGGKNRAITLVEKDDGFERRATFAPIVGIVTAGMPIFAVENIDGYSPLPDGFDNSDEDMFILKVHGNSMIEAGIFNGDSIIVKKSQTCDDGQIVVALVDDSATVKRFYRRDGKYVLHPENESFNDIILDDVSIIGVVKGLIRKF